MTRKILQGFSYHFGVIFGLILVMFFICRKIWRMEIPITTTNFADITLGMATAQNVDISQLIVWYLLYAVILSLLFAYFFHRFGYYEKLISKIKLKVKYNAWLENDNLFLVVIILVQILLGSINWLSLLYIFSLVILLIYFYKFKHITNKKDIIATWVSGICILHIPSFYLGKYLSSQTFFVVFALVLLSYLCYNAGKVNFIEKCQAYLYPYMLGAIASYLITAVMEILLLRGHEVYDVCILFPYVIAIAYSYFVVRKNDRLKYEYSNFNFYGTLTLMIFSYLPRLEMTFPIDFFELANNGVTVEEFVLGTGFPLINNLDAHLYSFTVPSIVYYALTDDYIGALFSPYVFMTCVCIGVLSFAYLLRQYFSKQEVLIMLMFFPWTFSFLYLWEGFIVFFVFFYWMRTTSILSSFFLMISFTALSFYRVDLGASFGLAVLICPIIYCLISKKYVLLLRYVSVAVLWSLCLFFVGYWIAMKYNTDIMLSIQSFVTAFSSNQHWGYGNLGEHHKIFWSYFILPIVASVLFYSYVKSIEGVWKSKCFWIFTFLYVTFVFSIPRMLTRHTLVIKQPYVCGIILVLTALLIINRIGKNRASIFITFMLCAFINISGFRNVNNMDYFLINADVAVRSVQANEHSYIKINDNDMKQIQALCDFCDSNLADGETYFDFTNQSLLYAFTKRHNPIYVNQTPGMINGYKGQKQAIASLEKENPKFVAMPYRPRGNNTIYNLYVDIDGILNTDRFYLLTDYITDNYRPYCAVGDFAIWCLKSEYANLRQRDEEGDIKREYLDYTYEPENHHKHFLGYIPLLWGKSNITNLTKENILLQENGGYLLTNENIIGQKGFVTLEIEASHNGDAILQFTGSDILPIEYYFHIDKGVHLYRLQVSSDILWHSGKVEELRLIYGDISIKNVYFEAINGSL